MIRMKQKHSLGFLTHALINGILPHSASEEISLSRQKRPSLRLALALVQTLLL